MASSNETGEIDLSLWTGLAQVVKPHPKDAPHSSSEGRVQTASPVSSTEDMPHTPNCNESTDGDMSPSITIPLSQLRHAHEFEPQRIAFIEGADELHRFPTYLYRQLQLFCQLKRTDRPDFIKNKWGLKGPTLTKSSSGGRAWFGIPDAEEELLQVRYSYGDYGQIVVVKQTGNSKTEFNRGRAAIVYPVSGFHKKTPRNGVGAAAQYKWLVWDPFGPQQAGYWVIRTIELASVQQQPRSETFNEEPRYGRIQTLSENGIVSPNCASKFHASLSSKLSSCSVEQTSPRRNSRRSCVTSLSLYSFDMFGDTHTARRDKATGELIVRKSDGELVAMHCTECDKKTFNTVQGLLFHLLTSHNIRMKTFQEVVEFCGCPIQHSKADGAKDVSGITAAGKTTTTGTPPSKRNHASIVTDAGEVNSSSHTTQSITTPPPKRANLSESVEIDDNEPDSAKKAADDKEVREVDFHFTKFATDKDTKEPVRVRPIKAIDSAQKLFYNAVVAGAATKYTFMFTVSINNGEPLRIVRGDQQDFEMILEAIRDTDAKKVIVTVAAEEMAV